MVVVGIELCGTNCAERWKGTDWVVSSTDGRGNATTFLYNAQGQRICAIDAATNATWYAFDAFGRLVAQTNALGEVTVYEYNLQGRKTYEGGGTYPVRFTYDDEGRMTGMTTYREDSDPVTSRLDVRPSPHTTTTPLSVPPPAPAAANPLRLSSESPRLRLLQLFFPANLRKAIRLLPNT